MAAENNWPRVVLKLLDVDANMDAKRVHDGWSSLHVAAYNGFQEVVEILLTEISKKGVQIRDTLAGQTASDLADEQGFIELADMIALSSMDQNMLSSQETSTGETE